MKKHFTDEEYLKVKSMDLLLCECYHCKNKFGTLKKLITREIKFNEGKIKFCSKKCNNLYFSKKIKLNCYHCGIEFIKDSNQIKKTKNHFCSQSCAAYYRNKNKIYGTRRSKLEIYLEEQLTVLYPNLSIEYNKLSAINSELDIFIPALNLAIELNGIVHYEPIYGVNKLEKIKDNDISKSKACHEAKIDLCIIDTSNQKKFKISTSQKYLDIIINIINERIC